MMYVCIHMAVQGKAQCLVDKSQLGMGRSQLGIGRSLVVKYALIAADNKPHPLNYLYTLEVVLLVVEQQL